MVPTTCIYTYRYDDCFCSSTDQLACARKNCISDSDAYSVFATIDAMIALKEQKIKDDVTIAYFKANPLNVFPILATITQQVGQNSALRHITMPLIFFEYALTSEFQLFYLANTIAQHLSNAKSDYHDYFCAVRKMFIARDYSTIKQVYDKYPRGQLFTLPNKEEQRKIATQTLYDNIQDMKLIIDKMSLDDIDDKFECSRLLNNCRSRYNGSRKTLNSVYKITDKKDK